MPIRMHWKIIVPIIFILIIIVWILYSFLYLRQNRMTPVELERMAITLAGKDAVNCGKTAYTGNAIQDEKNFFKVHACAVKVFDQNKNFVAFFEHEKFGFFNMLFGLVECDYVIHSPTGEYKLLTWTQVGTKIVNNPVKWSIKDLDQVHVSTWGYPGYEPILHYKDNQF